VSRKVSRAAVAKATGAPAEQSANSSGVEPIGRTPSSRVKTRGRASSGARSPRKQTEAIPPESAGADSPQVEQIPVTELKTPGRNARKHPKEQIDQLEASFTNFGITKPLLIDEANNVICGRGRLRAAIKKGIDTFPCVRVTDWSDVKKQAFAVAENRLGELSHWDAAVLQASVTESDVLKKLFPGTTASPEPPRKKAKPVVDDSLSYLTIGKTAIPLTAREQSTLVALLRHYVARFSVANGFWSWILGEADRA